MNEWMDLDLDLSLCSDNWTIDARIDTRKMVHCFNWGGVNEVFRLAQYTPVDGRINVVEKK